MITRVLFVLLTVLLTSSTHQNALIEWNAERKLTWNDFKAAPDAASANAALTSSSINMEFGYADTGWHYSIKCRFDKNRSWMRVKKDNILAHEQGHFDIAELYARKLNQALKAYQFNAKTVSTDVNNIYEKLMKQHHKAQNQYDHETDFSRNKTKQAAWLTRIAEDLKTMEPWADYQPKGAVAKR